jgi:hypothetical protein
MTEKRKWSFQTKKDKTKAPKKNYNPKSRDNLRQYTAKGTSDKDKLLQSMAEQVNIDPELLEVIIPSKKVFSTDEQKRFMKLVNLYFNELTSQDSKLTITDIQAMATLCKNAILEDRLLEDANNKEDKTAIAEVMASIDKLKKENAKLTESLATNRNVRVDPRAGKDITVMEVLYEFDNRTEDGYEENKLLHEFTEQEDKVSKLVADTVENMIT